MIRSAMAEKLSEIHSELSKIQLELGRDGLDRAMSRMLESAKVSLLDVQMLLGEKVR